MNIAILLDKLIKKINTEVFNENDIKEYINSLIDYMELNEYYKGIKFLKNNLNLGSYSFETLLIKLCVPHVIKIAQYDYLFLKLKCRKPLFINLSILEVIYHEIIHIFQNYVYLDSDFSFKLLYGIDINYLNSLDETDSTYEVYYNNFVIEREANITAFENVLRILKNHLHNEELFNYYFKEIKKYMNFCYDQTSPIEKLYSNLYKIEAPVIDNIDLYDRIKFGFQVSKDEWHTWENNQDTIILTKNNLQV